jgi:hypothetical protein
VSGLWAGRDLPLEQKKLEASLSPAPQTAQGARAVQGKCQKSHTIPASPLYVLLAAFSISMLHPLSNRYRTQKDDQVDKRIPGLIIHIKFFEGHCPGMRDQNPADPPDM